MKPNEKTDLSDPAQVPNDVKFNAELDFMNLLGDVTYVYFLVENGYLENPYFIAYLKYLEYWKRPEYAMLLRSNQSFYYLKNLQDAAFVQRLSAKVYLGEWNTASPLTYLEYLKQMSFYAQQNQKYGEGQEVAIERGRQ